MDKNGKDNVHKNHRMRMREKFNSIGFAGWSDYEILEYMLYNVYSRIDTNVIAHRLLDYSAGSIVTLLENSQDMSMAKDINGVGEKAVLYLRSLKEFCDFFKKKELTHRPIKLTRDTVNDIVHIIGFPTDRENILMICTDAFLNVKNIVNITTKNGSDFAGSSTDTIVHTAAANGAKYVLLVHNHPDGNKHVSAEDINMTSHADIILNSMGITLIDHLILCDGEYVSVKVTIFNSEEESEVDWDEQLY